MDIDYDKVVQSDIFKKWCMNDEDFFLSFVFGLIDKGKVKKWDFGFFIKSSNKVKVFSLKGDEVFSLKEDNQLSEKKPDKIKEQYQAFENFENIVEDIKQKLKKNGVNLSKAKVITVLNNEDDMTCWTFSTLLPNFKMLSLKYNAINKKFISENLKEFMKFNSKK
jgi:hypothetical protein